MLDFSNRNIDKTLPCISISQVLEQIQEPFDKIGVSEKVYKKYFDDPTSQYYQMTPEEIRKQWTKKGDKAKSYGRLLDSYIGLLSEHNFENNELIEKFKTTCNTNNDKHIVDLFESFDNFKNTTNIFDKFDFETREKTVYYRLENTNYDSEDLFPVNQYFYIKGRFDALLRHKNTGKWLIIDWKSSGSIDKEPNQFTKNLYGPADKFYALNWYTYTLQLHFYKKALIESRYLPEGTTDNDVAVKIVQLPGKIYNVESEAFKYNSKIMDKIFKCAWEK